MTCGQRAHATMIGILAIAQRIGDGCIEQQRATRLDVGTLVEWIDAVERALERIVREQRREDRTKAKRPRVDRRDRQVRRDQRANVRRQAVAEGVLDVVAPRKPKAEDDAPADADAPADPAAPSSSNAP